MTVYVVMLLFFFFCYIFMLILSDEMLPEFGDGFKSDLIDSDYVGVG